MNLSSTVSNVLIAAATGGAGIAAVNQVFARRKANAEAESIEADTAAKLIKGVTDELERLQGRQISIEKRFSDSEVSREEAERRVRAAERRAHDAYLAEQELRTHLATLLKAYNITRQRVEYLTEVVLQAGIQVSTWSTPPSGFDPKERV